MKRLLFLPLLAVLAVGCTAQDAVYVKQPVTVNGAVTIQEPLTVDGTVGVTGSISLSGATLEDGRIPTMAKPYDVGIAEGDIAGHTLFSRIGFNPTVGNTREDVCSSSNTYTFPTAAAQLEVVSSSVEDDPVKADTSAGTGVHAITIYYLDGSYVSKTVDVTLNGTAVATTSVSDIFRINDIHAKTVGTGYAAAGTISIRNLADTPVYGEITAGYTTSRCLIWTVPHGKTLYVSEFYGAVAGLAADKQCRMTLRATYDDNAGSLLTAGLFFMTASELMLSNASGSRHFNIPIRFPAHTDVKVSAVVDTGSGVVESVIRGWIE